MDYLFIVKLSGFIVVLVVFSMRIERRLTKIETNIVWIIKKLDSIGSCNSTKGKES